MLSLRLEGVCFEHAPGFPLFSELDLRLAPGWHGVVGENGAGKSTLLRLLNAELRPQRGHVRATPADARIVLCEQTVDTVSPEVRALADANDGEAHSLRARLRLEPDELARWDSLSPGERRRWQIGAALFAEPDVLLLDEPTNHLDAEGRALLVSALRRFRGIGLVVSHDRALLDALVTAVVRVHRGEATVWSGSYEAARAQWVAARESDLRTHRDAREAREREARKLADARRDHQASVAQTSARARMKSVHDSDQRGILAQGRAESAERRLGRAVATLRAREARAEVRVSEGPVIEKELGRSLFVRYERATTPWLAVLSGEPVRAGQHVVLHDARVSVGREDRVRLVGPNGAGKTTLMRALLASLRVPRERVLYLPQEQSPLEVMETLDAVRALPRDEKGQVLSLVAALGVDPEALLRSRAPSPGEARKLALALGLGRGAWALLLDEPTNHLDLPSIERLESALEGYPGALLFVTHDEGFATACARTVWDVGDGRVVPRV